jgi:hypothetical protein
VEEEGDPDPEDDGLEAGAVLGIVLAVGFTVVGGAIGGVLWYQRGMKKAIENVAGLETPEPGVRENLGSDPQDVFALSEG